MLALGGTALLVALNASVLVERLGSVLTAYPLFITEGGEGPHVYAIWRLLHGLPLYLWPHQEPYVLTLYNALFYRGYAAVLGASGVDGEAILLGGRLVTLGAALAGAAVTAWLMLRLLPREAWLREVPAVVIGFAAVLWLGSNFASWWPLSIRPDVPALVFVAMGLVFALRAIRHDRPTASLLAASLAFFLAWGFKQTVVLTLAGTLAFLVLDPCRRRQALALALPFVALVSVALWAGGPAYRFNVLTAGTAGRIVPAHSLAIFARVFTQNALVWLLPALLAALAAWRRRRGAAGAIPFEAKDRLLATVFAAAMVGGLVALGRESANENQLFEAYLAGGLLGVRGSALLGVRASPPLRRAGLTAVAALVVPMLTFPAAQLVFPDRFGVTHLASPTDLARKQALAGRLRTLPKPLFIVDDVLAQPWHASPGTSEAYVLDVYWTQLAERDGVLPRGLVEASIRGHRFRTVIDEPGGRFARAAREAGLECAALPELAPRAVRLVACTDGIREAPIP